MRRILVIGATGNVGGHVVSQLPPAVRVRALCRNPQVARMPAGVEIVPGDLTCPETLDAALEAIDAVFLVWTAPLDAIDPALDRILKQARRVVFLSALLKTPHPLFQQPNPIRAVAELVEARIESSSAEWTILRPGMFASNALAWWAPQFRSGNVIRWPFLDVPTAPIDPRDIAAVAVRALCDDGPIRAERLLTGPESLTHREQISTIAGVLDRTVRIEEMSPEEAPHELPFPPVIAKMLLDAWSAAAGYPAFLAANFAGLTGAPPRRFRQWAADHAAGFQLTSRQPA